MSKTSQRKLSCKQRKQKLYFAGAHGHPCPFNKVNRRELNQFYYGANKYLERAYDGEGREL
jgi:hypothetical protein